MTNWKITFPIEKAEKREDGLFITGLASGPEIDAQGERMDGELITRFADQVNSTGGLALSQRLVYRDAHAPDGVLRDLGWISKAWVNQNQQLGVEVKLDEDNPAAVYLFKQLDKGKQYGMSVAGKVLDFTDEFIADVGAVVRTYLDVILTEISNTTRPAWTPSFGSVLAKALMATEDGAFAKGADIPAPADVKPLGEHMSEEITMKAPERVEVEVVDAPTLPAPAGAPDIADVPSQPEGESPDAPKEPEGTPVDVPEAQKAAEAVVEADMAKDAAQQEAAQKDLFDAASAAYTLSSVLSLLGYAKSDDVSSLRDAANALVAFVSSEVGATAAKAMKDAEVVTEPTPETPTLSDAEKADLMSQFSNLGKAMVAAGLIAPTPEIETAPETTSEDEGENLTTKTDTETPEKETTPAQPSYEDLARSYAELTEKVAVLEAAPLTQLPPLVERSADDEVEDFRKGLSELPRDARLRAAFAAHTGSK